MQVVIVIGLLALAVALPEPSPIAKARLVSYVADENGYRGEIKDADGPPPDPSGSQGTSQPVSPGASQAVSVTNAKLVEVAPVKYKIRHSPVFHYYAGGATRDDSPTRVRVSLRKKEKGGEKPVETIVPAVTYYGDWSAEEEDALGSAQPAKDGVNKDGVLRKIPHYSEPFARAVESGPTFYSENWDGDQSAGVQPERGDLRKVSIAYSPGWPTQGEPVDIVQQQPRILPIHYYKYAPAESQLGDQGVQPQPDTNVENPQSIRKMDQFHSYTINHNVPGVQYATRWSHGYRKPIAKYPVQYVSSWYGSKKEDSQPVVVPVREGVPVAHYTEDIKKADYKPFAIPMFNHPAGLHRHLEKLKDHTIKIGETIERHLSQYASVLSPVRKETRPVGGFGGLHKLIKPPVVYHWSLPSGVENGKWEQSSLNPPTWDDAKKVVEKVSAVLPYAAGWANWNENPAKPAEESPKLPDTRSWPAVPAWW